MNWKNSLLLYFVVVFAVLQCVRGHRVRRQDLEDLDEDTRNDFINFGRKLTRENSESKQHTKINNDANPRPPPSPNKQRTSPILTPHHVPLEGLDQGHNKRLRNVQNDRRQPQRKVNIVPKGREENKAGVDEKREEENKEIIEGLFRENLVNAYWHAKIRQPEVEEGANGEEEEVKQQSRKTVGVRKTEGHRLSLDDNLVFENRKRTNSRKHLFVDEDRDVQRSHNTRKIVSKPNEDNGGRRSPSRSIRKRRTADVDDNKGHDEKKGRQQAFQQIVAISLPAEESYSINVYDKTHRTPQDPQKILYVENQRPVGFAADSNMVQQHVAHAQNVVPGVDPLHKPHSKPSHQNLVGQAKPHSVYKPQKWPVNSDAQVPEVEEITYLLLDDQGKIIDQKVVKNPHLEETSKSTVHVPPSTNVQPAQPPREVHTKPTIVEKINNQPNSDASTNVHIDSGVPVQPHIQIEEFATPTRNETFVLPPGTILNHDDPILVAPPVKKEKIEVPKEYLPETPKKPVIVQEAFPNVIIPEQNKYPEVPKKQPGHPIHQTGPTLRPSHEEIPSQVGDSILDQVKPVKIEVHTEAPGEITVIKHLTPIDHTHTIHVDKVHVTDEVQVPGRFSTTSIKFKTSKLREKLLEDPITADLEPEILEAIQADEKAFSRKRRATGRSFAYQQGTPIESDLKPVQPAKKSRGSAIFDKNAPENQYLFRQRREADPDPALTDMERKIQLERQKIILRINRGYRRFQTKKQSLDDIPEDIKHLLRTTSPKPAISIKPRRTRPPRVKSVVTKEVPKKLEVTKEVPKEEKVKQSEKTQEFLTPPALIEKTTQEAPSETRKPEQQATQSPKPKSLEITPPTAAKRPPPRRRPTTTTPAPELTGSTQSEDESNRITPKIRPIRRGKKPRE